MPLIAIPNVSEGSDETRVARLTQAASMRGARVLDVHSDAIHDRSVLTVTGTPDRLIDGMIELAKEAVRAIDLRLHRGVHPRLGAFDVCPFVPHGDEVSLAEAVAVARRVAPLIAEEVGVPVYLYGAAALRDETRDLPDLRRGGLESLAVRAGTDLPPDHGDTEIDAASGVVCVGARSVLIAMNVWFRCGLEVVRSIAKEIRTSGGGPPGMRALGLELGDGWSQVSINLIDPDRTGIDAGFEAVHRSARTRGVEPRRLEIVGLVPERYLPEENAEAARLLDPPGRSLESALRERKQ